MIWKENTTTLIVVQILDDPLSFPPFLLFCCHWPCGQMGSELLNVHALTCGAKKSHHVQQISSLQKHKRIQHKACAVYTSSFFFTNRLMLDGKTIIILKKG